MKKAVCNMTETEKQRLVEISGKTVLWLEEYRSVDYIAKKLNLLPWQVEENLDQMLYILRKRVGIWRYLKLLFWK